MITQWIKPPEAVIHRIAQYPNWLIGGGPLRGEYFFNAFPIQIPDRGISVDHPIIPIGELVIQRIQI
jgi:hypothetical protein